MEVNKLTAMAKNKTKQQQNKRDHIPGYTLKFWINFKAVFFYVWTIQIFVPTDLGV